jgi:hypothetical protein
VPGSGISAVLVKLVISALPPVLASNVMVWRIPMIPVAGGVKGATPEREPGSEIVTVAVVNVGQEVPIKAAPTQTSVLMEDEPGGDGGSFMTSSILRTGPGSNVYVSRYTAVCKALTVHPLEANVKLERSGTSRGVTVTAPSPIVTAPPLLDTRPKLNPVIVNGPKEQVKSGAS